MKTLTLAALYESQGHIEDAIVVYQEILENDPANEVAKEALGRLIVTRKSFSGVNEKMKNYFVKMNKKEHYEKFERWLATPWN